MERIKEMIQEASLMLSDTPEDEIDVASKMSEYLKEFDQYPHIGPLVSGVKLSDLMAELSGNEEYDKDTLHAIEKELDNLNTVVNVTSNCALGLINTYTDLLLTVYKNQHYTECNKKPTNNTLNMVEVDSAIRSLHHPDFEKDLSGLFKITNSTEITNWVRDQKTDVFRLGNSLIGTYSDNELEDKRSSMQSIISSWTPSDFNMNTSKLDSVVSFYLLRDGDHSCGLLNLLESMEPSMKTMTWKSTSEQMEYQLMYSTVRLLYDLLWAIVNYNDIADYKRRAIQLVASTFKMYLTQPAYRVLDSMITLYLVLQCDYSLGYSEKLTKSKQQLDEWILDAEQASDTTTTDFIQFIGEFRQFVSALDTNSLPKEASNVIVRFVKGWDTMSHQSDSNTNHAMIHNDGLDALVSAMGRMCSPNGVELPTEDTMNTNKPVHRAEEMAAAHRNVIEAMCGRKKNQMEEALQIAQTLLETTDDSFQNEDNFLAIGVKRLQADVSILEACLSSMK